MKSALRGCVRVVVAAAVVSLLQSASPAFAQGKPDAAAARARFCTVPTAPAGSLEETAWRIFVAINCPKDGLLTWEAWTEQTCLTAPATPGCTDSTKKTRFLHVSVLSTRNDPTKRLAGDCAGMVTQQSFSGQNPPPASLKPFVPKNLTATAVFCEEVYVNPSEANFITSPPGAASGVNLQSLTGQATYIKAKGPLQFPTDALEVKADWLPADAVAPAFDCQGNKPKGVYVETIGGKCYALAGIHISSKLYPNWLWATFEPQNPITNPNRCNPKLYSNCNDPWGSNPAVSTGKATAATKNLTNLMNQAGLAPEFRNYRLVGVQRDFAQPKGTLGLGNSFTEYNAQVPARQASCITCHSYAMMNTAVTPPSENPNFGPFPNTPPIGKPGPPPAGNWIPQDFSWLMGIMPAQGN